MVGPRPEAGLSGSRSLGGPALHPQTRCDGRLTQVGLGSRALRGRGHRPPAAQWGPGITVASEAGLGDSSGPRGQTALSPQGPRPAAPRCGSGGSLGVFGLSYCCGPPRAGLGPGVHDAQGSAQPEPDRSLSVCLVPTHLLQEDSARQEDTSTVVGAGWPGGRRRGQGKEHGWKAGPRASPKPGQPAWGFPPA